jgi:ferrous iron transport protein B
MLGQRLNDHISVPAGLALLVFFVLAMQCLPTQVVTRRETGSWNWALLQFGYMTVLAYSAALITYQVASQFV